MVAPTPALIELGAYPFWAVEHMYTAKNADALSLSFIKYVAQNLPTGDSFIHLGAMNPSVLASHS